MRVGAGHREKGLTQTDHPFVLSLVPGDTGSLRRYSKQRTRRLDIRTARALPLSRTTLCKSFNFVGLRSL